MRPSPSPPSRASSPGLGLSQFTWRHLSQLASYGPTSPLRVIAHIDMDAFYAQCEMIRLGVPRDLPLAVQQWQGLIAVNYPARKFGITRHCNVAEARKLCPQLIAQHVATWREGDERWAYHEASDMHTHKVSLDPYRLQSRKIMALVKECLPADLQRVEKASVDEVFLDLSAHVHSILLQRFPELATPPPQTMDASKVFLPMPPPSAVLTGPHAVHTDVGVGARLESAREASPSDAQSAQDDADEDNDDTLLVDIGDQDAEAVDPDWDDVCIMVGAQIVSAVRAAIFERLGYTTSAGVASNKMISKLASAHRKPNAQTVVRPRAVPHFLSGKKFTQIRLLGGKRGEKVVAAFGTEQVTELLVVSPDQMKAKLGAETGSWVYQTVRGIDTSEVTSRTQIKSMLSAKSFTNPVVSGEQMRKWLRIFAGDIYARLEDEGVTENRRRPRSLNLHFRHGGGLTRSRSCPIPQGRPLEEKTLFDLAGSLLGHILAEAGSATPCESLSLSVTGFEEHITGNLGIGSFLVRGEKAQELRKGRDAHSSPSSVSMSAASASRSAPDSTAATTYEGSAAKRRRIEPNIQSFFAKKSPAEASAPHDGSGRPTSVGAVPEPGGPERAPHDAPADDEEGPPVVLDEDSLLDPIGAYVCPRCGSGLSFGEDVQSHQDWHMAVDLDREERGRAALAPRQQTAASAGTVKRGRGGGGGGSRRGGSGGGGGKLERGQGTLKFG